MEGSIPAYAIKNLPAIALTRGFQIVQGIGIVLSIYDLRRAAKDSYKQKSLVPLTEETIKQSAGWSGGAAGRTVGKAAFSWAARRAAAMEGAELVAVSGALLGVETGPGAIITAGIGSLIFGSAAFFGAEWATKKLLGEE